MSKSGLFGRLACKLNLHFWNIEQRGRAINGSIYPIRRRNCLRCQLRQQETLDINRDEVVWVTLQDKND